VGTTIHRALLFNNAFLCSRDLLHRARLLKAPQGFSRLLKAYQGFSRLLKASSQGFSRLLKASQVSSRLLLKASQGFSRRAGCVCMRGSILLWSFSKHIKGLCLVALYNSVVLVLVPVPTTASFTLQVFTRLLLQFKVMKRMCKCPMCGRGLERCTTCDPVDIDPWLK